MSKLPYVPAVDLAQPDNLKPQIWTRHRIASASQHPMTVANQVDPIARRVLGRNEPLKRENRV